MGSGYSTYSAVWDLLHHLTNSSPPANSIPALVPDDGSNALNLLLSCFDLLLGNRSALLDCIPGCAV